MGWLKNFFNDHKTACIMGIIIIVLIIFCILLINRCNKLKDERNDAEHNVSVLVDSIEYYKSKTDNLVAEKLILIGDNDLLKATNADLYNKLSDMKVKNAEQALEIEGLITNPKVEFIWQIDTVDLGPKHLYEEFIDEDEYHRLAGNIKMDNDSLSLAIIDNTVMFDYTIAVKDGKVYVMSDNPYVKYSNITGITEPSNKKKHWGFGFNLGIGGQYGFIYKKIDFGPTLSFGVNYSF